VLRGGFEIALSATGISLGQIAQINLSGNEKCFVYWMHNPLTQFLFNSGALVPWQHISVGKNNILFWLQRRGDGNCCPLV
jgi:hypothetical protein